MLQGIDISPGSLARSLARKMGIRPLQPPQMAQQQEPEYEIEVLPPSGDAPEPLGHRPAAQAQAEGDAALPGKIVSEPPADSSIVAGEIDTSRREEHAKKEQPVVDDAPTRSEPEVSEAPTEIIQLAPFIGFKVKDWKGEEKDIDIRGERITIGRSPSCDLTMKGDPSLSKEHATLIYRDGQFFIMDNGSSNGTFIDRRRIPPHVYFRINPETEIEIGSSAIRIDRINGSRIKPPKRAMLLLNATGVSRQNVFPALQCYALDTNEGKTRARLGSSSDCELMVPGRDVAPVHASIDFDADGSLVLRSEPGLDVIVTSKHKGTVYPLNNGHSMRLGKGGVSVAIGQNTGLIHQISNGDTIHIGGNDISVVLVPSQTESNTSEAIYLRNGEFAERHKTFFKELRIMENAIRTLPEKQAEEGLEIWAMAIQNELSKLPEDDDACGYERLMASMNYLVGRACCHAKAHPGENPLAFFRFMEKNPERVQFGLLAKRFAGRRSHRLRSVKVRMDEELLKAIQRSASAHNGAGWGFGAALDCIRNDIGADEYEELSLGLKSKNYSTHGKALAGLNERLNPRGVFVWEKGDEFTLYQAISIIYSDIGKSVMVRPLEGYPDIFSRDDGLAISGFFSPTSGMIVLAEDWSYRHSLKTHEHEIQHLIDELSGHTYWLSRTYGQGSKEKRARQEATAIAAEYAYSEMDDEAIIQALLKRKKLKSEHGRGTAMLLQYSQRDRPKGLLAALRRKKEYWPMKERLREYLDKEYGQALGITYTDLFYGPDKSPQEISGGTLMSFSMARTRIRSLDDSN